MALPSTHRWVTIGRLHVRNHARAPETAPQHRIDDLFAALRAVEGQPEGRRNYLSDDKRMWTSHVQQDDNYVYLMIEVGDKRIADPSFFDFQANTSRTGIKLATEGGHFCAHVLIARQPDRRNKYLILCEKVPGVQFYSLTAHLNWLLRGFPKSIEIDGAERAYTGKVVIEGQQSRTLQDAIDQGSLQDVELVGHKTLDAGADEDSPVREETRQIRWSIKRRVSREEAVKVFSDAFTKLRGWTPVEGEERHLLVRIKSKDNQIKTSEITSDAEAADEAAREALESTFYLNEIIKDFDEDLTQSYSDLRQDVLNKMRALAVRGE
ncbi:hypothetical protein [Frigidibacter sp. MR17.24]|uniref:hypothetical protein n=1 Tax=Frigidibacter sp. MR17.24 TaxID=3127345 RepID=UPI003012AA99